MAETPLLAFTDVGQSEPLLRLPKGQQALCRWLFRVNFS